MDALRIPQFLSETGLIFTFPTSGSDSDEPMPWPK